MGTLTVVFFHNNFFQFDLSLGCVVERTEVRFEFVVEAVPICKPYRLGSNFAEDRWFEVLEHRTGKVRDGILNFCHACSESFGVVLEEEERLALELWVFLEGVAMVSYSFLSQ